MSVSYSDLLESFFGRYSETYCSDNGLFISKKSDDTVEYKTRQIVSYNQDVILTDLNFILGEWQEITSEDKNAVEDLEMILENNEWDKSQRLAILQGLILGTTALKIGVDANKKARVGLARLNEVTLTPVYDTGKVIKWILEYETKQDKDSNKKIKEIFTETTYQRFENDVDITGKVPTNDRWWFYVIQNRPSIDQSDDWKGESEWNAIRSLVDEINSIHSRIARIEDIYADPRFLITGINDISQLQRAHKAWAVPEGGSISILEYQGNTLDSMMRRIEILEKALKAKAPELIINDLGDISGYALRMKLSKLEKKINTLRTNYFKIFQEVFKTLYLLEYKKEATFNIKADFTLPQDIEALLNELTTLHGLGAVSLETLATELGYNYQEEQKKIQKEYGSFQPPVNEDDEISNPSR